jgi:L-alanine-DL-glutamate epimerase-like enolase superfamily enzyme
MWDVLAELPLVIERCEYEQLDPGAGFGEAHSTRLVRLVGKGADGLGEDITLFMSEAPELSLEGTWTLGSFCAHLARIEQWAEPPTEWADGLRRYRNWAFESAALDLALNQAGRPLHEVLGREPRPITFVNSLGLGEPASADKVLGRLERYPQLRFKLDAAPDWSDEIVEALVGSGAVHTIDFKGRYEMDVEDFDALAAMYERVVAAFPEALLEDPHAELMHLVDPERVSWDAPIHAVADLDAHPARTYNIKPTRIGNLTDLFALYEACEARGHALYGGGMGELGVARGQVQLLASLFSPDGPNDIAPPGFNAVEPAEGLPVSPLPPDPAPTGFRRVS